MKIMVVMPAPQGVMGQAEQRVTKTVLGYASGEVEIVIGFPTEHTGHVPRGGGGGAFGTARNHVAVAERMVQAEAEGVDACIPYGMSDYGAELARTRCTIPVVGQSRAAYTMASLMAERWGCINYQSAQSNGTRRQMREYGFEGYLAGSGAVDIPISEMWDRSPKLLQRFAEEGKRLVKDFGAELIICHGMSMSPIEFSSS